MNHFFCCLPGVASCLINDLVATVCTAPKTVEAASTILAMEGMSSAADRATSTKGRASIRRTSLVETPKYNFFVGDQKFEVSACAGLLERGGAQRL